VARVFDLEVPIGRDEELDLADGMVRATLADAGSTKAHARALIVGGDAGIGKTTLMHALGSRASALGLGFTVGHCLDIATGLPFGPVVEALRSYVSEGTGRAALLGPAAWLDARTPSAEAPQMDTLLAAAASLAEAEPFVLVLEDLHWADESVRDWAIALVRTCRAPLLLGLTVRTEEVSRHHPLRPVLVELGRSPGTLRVELQGLTAAPIAELARRRTGRTLRGRTIDSLVQRSEGNPLFVEELLDGQDGVPVLLHDLLLRHVDRLADRPQFLCRLASVAGTVVDVDVLRGACGLDAHQFAAAMQEVLDANVIVRRRDAFSFRHALLREAIHDEMLPSTRSEMHAAWAGALRPRVEAGSPTERWQYGAALAVHAYAAHDLPLAFVASVRAGLAGKQYGAAAAADHLERALQLWDRVPDAAELSGLAKTDLPVLAARVLSNEGVRERVHALLRQAVDLTPGDGDPLAACRVYLAIGAEWIQVPGLLSQDEALGMAIDLAGTTPSRELAYALVAGCFRESCRYQFGAALLLAGRALAVAAKVGADDLVPEARWELSGALWGLGRCDEALEMLGSAVHEAEEAAQTGAALEAAGELACDLLARGRIDDGLALARRTRDAAHRAGLPRLVAFAAEQEVEWLIQDGQFAAAEALDLKACLPGVPNYRKNWLRFWLLLARGEGAAALALEDEWVVAHGTGPNLEHSLRLIQASEQTHDLARLLSATEAMLAQGPTDSPLLLAHAARHGLHARVLARAAGLVPSAELARLSDTALAFARSRMSRQWDASIYGMHLAVGSAHEAHLAGRPGVVEWRHASKLAARFGRYTALAPRLELARALLADGDRNQGKELLVGLWRESRGMGAGWIEEQAALSARKFRVVLPLDRSGPGPLDRLTPREREVLDLVATGATDHAIAAALFITEKTASAHVGHVLAKLGVANRGKAAAAARAAEPQDKA
jgi:DNA-binding CsgD family transcriptional regulator/tetratricopeptide (TPR) repeat protein